MRGVRVNEDLKKERDLRALVIGTCYVFAILVFLTNSLSESGYGYLSVSFLGIFVFIGCFITYLKIDKTNRLWSWLLFVPAILLMGKSIEIIYFSLGYSAP